MRSLLAAAPLAMALVALPAAAHGVGPVATAPEQVSLDGRPGHLPQAVREARLERALAQQVAEREQALDTLFDEAEAHEQAEEERAAALADAGWTGDPDAASVVHPLSGYYVSAGFGARGDRWSSLHTGLDLAAPIGTPLVAAADATITSVGDAGAYGLRTVLTLEDGTELWYCHQSAALVSVGDTVAVADPVGRVGDTGNTTGPHLHLEVRPAGGGPVDPVPWFSALGLSY